MSIYIDKGVLFVGGGILQSYAILIARSKGIKIYLIDGNRNCYCSNLADEFFKIDTKDHLKAAELAMKLKEDNKINGVYTQGTDVAYTVAYAAQKSGLPHLTPSAAYSTENKALMRKILYQNGIDNTKFLVIENEKDLRESKNEIGFPLYVKPVDNSGSRGVSRVLNHSDLVKAYKNAKKNNIVHSSVILEEEIIGNEYSIDTIVYDGIVFNAGISDRIFRKKEKYAVQGGSITPSLLPSEKQNEMIELMSKIAKVFKINNSALKGDLIIDENNKVRIIEIAARTSGGFDSQVRKPASFGIDIISFTLDISLGLIPQMRQLIPRWIKWSKTISIFPQPGIIKEIIGIDWLERNKDIIDYKILSKVGDALENYTDCATRKNYVTFKADTFTKLKELEIKIKNKLKIVTF